MTTLRIGSNKVRLKVGSAVALPRLNTATANADMLRIAIVDGQVVDDASIDVDVVAFAFDPSKSLAPPTIDGADMGTATLTWPGTSDSSIDVYRSSVNLSVGSNYIAARSGKSSDAITIHRVSSLTVVQASNASDAIAKMKAAWNGTSPADVVEIDYAESDFGRNVLDGIGTGLSVFRSGFLTVKASSSGSIAFDTNGTVGTGDRFLPRLPSGADLCIEGATIGSSSSNTAVGYYDMTNHAGRLWLKDCTIQGKYNTTDYTESDQFDTQWTSQWPKSVTNGISVSATGCEWNGTVFKQATAGWELVRDCRFIEHRGDINNHGRLVVNNYCQDLQGITFPSGADITHQDLFQTWGQDSGWNPDDVMYYGMRVGQNNLTDFDGQPIFFSRTYSPQYERIIIDTITVDAPADTARSTQFAGEASDVRVSNITHSSQRVIFRMYSADGTAWDPDSSVFFDNWDIDYASIVEQSGSTTVKLADLASPPEAAPELNADSRLQGSSGQTPTFSNITLNE